jgi:membrane-bound lytic murein transglycosylase A
MRWGVIAAALLLGACSGGIVPPATRPAPPSARPSRPPPARVPEIPGNAAPVRQPTPSTPIAAIPASPPPEGVTTAVAAGVLAGPPVSALPIASDSAAAALRAFRLSCPSLVKRSDASGLTRGADWQPACDAARGASERDATPFFTRWFEAVQVADGKAFATGYYEPEIAGSRDRRPGYDTPVYARPKDLIEVELGLFSADLKGKIVRGRVDGTKLVPYYDRGQIDDGALEGKGLEIGWAADPIELFFLEIQGSGRLRLPDGGVLRIGYAGQNGRDYVGIGSLLRQRNILPPGGASMQGIIGWLRANLEQGRALMRENKSYIFFRELTGAGPLGAMGYAVSGGTSAAVDPKFVPLGAPVLLSMDRADANGIWVAQDTGGAIRGANRFDTFWGAGADARATAGGMSARGTAFLLLPVGTLARLQAERASGGPTPQR